MTPATSPPTTDGATADGATAPAARRPSPAAVAAGAAGVAALAALGPLLLTLGARLWRSEHYDFFPLVLLGAGYLAWDRLRSDAGGGVPAGRVRGWVAALLWIPPLVLAALAIPARSNWLGGVAAMFVFPAAAYAWGGRPLCRRLAPVWLFLWLTVPPPLDWDLRFVLALQHAATGWAGGVLDLFGYRHMVRGVTLEFPGRAFLVEEACSGIHSLFAALCSVGFYLAWARRGAARSAVLLAAAVFWVTVLNVARVLAITTLSLSAGADDWGFTLAGRDWNLSIVDGPVHEALGFLIFAAALGLTVSTDALTLFLVPRPGADADRYPRATPAADDPRPPAVAEDGPAAKAGVPWRWAVPAAAFGLLAAAQLAQPDPVRIGSLTAVNAAGLKRVPESAAPERFGDWRRVRFAVRERDANALAGQFSRIWWYTDGRRTAALSIDGPFDHWHDLSMCYSGLGWHCADVDDVRYPAGPGGYTELTLEDGGKTGLVLFGAYTADHDRPLDPAAQRLGVRRKFANVDRFVSALFGGTAPGGDDGGPDADAAAEEDREPDPGEVGRTYQVQLFTEDRQPLTDAERDELRDLFHAVRAELVAAAARTDVFEAGPVDSDAGTRGDG